MNEDQVNSLAEKIAQVISTEFKSGDLATIRKNLDSINQRLDRIESSAVISNSESQISNFRSQISNSTEPMHPSQDRFDIAEAIADRLFDTRNAEKTCTFEPVEKPCDHCSMCSSRGF